MIRGYDLEDETSQTRRLPAEARFPEYDEGIPVHEPPQWCWHNNMDVRELLDLVAEELAKEYVSLMERSDEAQEEE